MSEPFVILNNLADELGIDRSFAKKYVRKLGVKPQQRRTPESGNQLTLTVSTAEADFIRKKREADGFLGSQKPVSKEVGVFYVIRLVPELDPRRVKLGFADDLASRWSQHRTAAPTAQVVKSWPCRRAWEGTAMDCLAAAGCRLILNEVFECDDVDGLVRRGDELFRLLSDPATRAPLAEASPHNK